MERINVLALIALLALAGKQDYNFYHKQYINLNKYKFQKKFFIMTVYFQINKMETFY